MTATTYGINVHFGTGYSTQLPADWELVESCDDFAFAVTPDGKEYYLGPDRAYPRRKWASQDHRPPGTKIGGHYMDTENGIVNL